MAVAAPQLRRLPPRHGFRVKHRDHARLVRMVEGAVVDAFRQHPEYLTPAGIQSAVGSITKRVVGTIVGHAMQTREGGRFGGCEAGLPIAVNTGGGVAETNPPGAGSVASSAGREDALAYERPLTGGEGSE